MPKKNIHSLFFPFPSSRSLSVYSWFMVPAPVGLKALPCNKTAKAKEKLKKCNMKYTLQQHACSVSFTEAA